MSDLFQKPSPGDDVGYCLYNHAEHGPIIVCVQWFDIHDYDEDRWIISDVYQAKEGAEYALLKLLQIFAKSGANTANIRSVYYSAISASQKSRA